MSESGATAGLAGQSHPSEDDEEGPASLGDRVRSAAAVPARMFGALFLPDRWLPVQVQASRYGAALIAFIVCGLLGAGAIALRLDVRSDVMAQAARPHGPPGGMGGSEKANEPPPTKSDRELQEEIDKKLATERVGGLLGAGLVDPLKLALLAVVIYLILLYVGGTPTIGKTFTATAHAALPFAVKGLVVAVAVLSQASLTPAQAESIVGNPLQPVFAGLGPIGEKFFTGVDPFLLWSILIMGFGMAAAGQITRKRAFVTIGWVMVLYLALSNFACGQPPEGDGPPQQMQRR